MKNPFRRIAQAFILTVGITPPTPAEERVATIFISVLLAGAVLVAGVFGLFLLRKMLT